MKTKRLFWAEFGSANYRAGCGPAADTGFIERPNGHFLGSCAERSSREAAKLPDLLTRLVKPCAPGEPAPLLPRSLGRGPHPRGFGELLKDPLAQIDEPPAHDAMDGRDWPILDHPRERRPEMLPSRKLDGKYSRSASWPMQGQTNHHHRPPSARQDRRLQAQGDLGRGTRAARLSQRCNRQFAYGRGDPAPRP